LKGKPRPVFIEVMLEHQSESQHLMPLRILGMVVRRYETLLRNASTAPQRLPVVLPVVLFQGESDGRSWRHSRRLRDLLDADDDTLDALSTFIPDFEFALDDLTQQSIDALHARSLSSLAYATLRLLRDARTNPRLLQDLQTPREMTVWFDISRGPDGLMDLARILFYILNSTDFSRREIRSFAHHLGTVGKDAEMTAADRLIASVAPQIRAEGAATMLRRLLELKFGPLEADTDARLRGASLGELEGWIDRILSAESISDVFDS
jgi:hypothetical protein